MAEHEKKTLRHELRTCVNQILGYSQLVEEDLAKAGQPGSVPDVKRVESAARRLLALVDQVPEGAEAPEWSPSPSSARARGCRSSTSRT